MSVLFPFGHSVITLVIVLGMAASVQAQNLSFTLREQLVIGDDEGASDEYIFSYPELVRTDSKGNIYVKDRMRMDVRVFDASGRYVTEIGREGEGPGEMRDITGMHVDDQDRLIVADRLSSRFTIFTDLGKSFETKALPEKNMIYPDIILSLDDSFLLRYVKLFDDPEGGSDITDDQILHIYDTELNWLETFAQLEGIFDMDRPFLSMFSSVQGALKVATNGSDVIFLAPKVYDGYLYRYKRSNNVWGMEKLKGGPVPKRAYIPVSERDFETNRDYRSWAITMAGPTGIFHAKVLNHCIGIAIRSTGEIVNLTRQTPLRKDQEYSAELFDPNGNLLGYGPLQFDDPRLNGNELVMSEIEFLWNDAADRTYIRRRNEHGFYVLSVAELVIKKL